MLLVRQALAEYAVLVASRGWSVVRLAVRQAGDVISENFVIAIAVLVTVVMLFTLRSGRMR